MKNKRAYFIIYITLSALVLLGLIVLNIVKASNGIPINDVSDPFLFAPITACKLTCVGISLAFGIFTLISHRKVCTKTWASFIGLFLLFGFSADLFNALGQRFAFYILFVAAYTAPLLFQKPSLVEGIVRSAVLIVASVLAVILADKFSETVRLSAIVAVCLFVSVGFAVYRFVKERTKFRLFIMVGLLCALVSDAFLALAYLTNKSSFALASCFSIFVWPTYLIEYVFLNAALALEMNEKENQ